MRYIYLIAFISLILLESCNINNNEAKLSQKVDSLLAITDSIDKEKIKNEILNLKAQYEGTYNRLSVEVSNLEVKEANLESIKSFELLRTREEKEEQIKAQVLVILKAEKGVNDCNDRLNKIKERLKQIDPNFSVEELVFEESPVVEF